MLVQCGPFNDEMLELFYDFKIYHWLLRSYAFSLLNGGPKEQLHDRNPDSPPLNNICADP